MLLVAVRDHVEFRICTSPLLSLSKKNFRFRKRHKKCQKPWPLPQDVRCSFDHASQYAQLVDVKDSIPSDMSVSQQATLESGYTDTRANLYTRVPVGTGPTRVKLRRRPSTSAASSWLFRLRSRWMGFLASKPKVLASVQKGSRRTVDHG